MTAEAAAASGPPRRRLPWVLLALSLALNLFFIAGALWFHFHQPLWRMTPEERVERMSAELHLDDAHKETFRRYFRQLGARMLLMRTEVQPLIGDAWAEIGKPQADEAKIDKLFDQAADTRRRFQRELTSQTLAFLATLTPEQRAKFVQLARHPPPFWARPFNRGMSP